MSGIAAKIAHSASDMIAGMAPSLLDGLFVFASTTDNELLIRTAPHVRGLFLEAEGSSLILPLDVATAEGLDISAPMHCITLTVHSALDGVGLTAAVASALADHNIPCNMVAAFYHDHVFVPETDAANAMRILQALQKNQCASESP
ncbi:ACT domain-containing protein [Sulfitobacter guttiformis]|uniref:CASTOR ACT domain-containing protein n=1 Tax=Sulfitobacter guttiformis TaxID=74349 RepID=A0A420DQ56_9RHOB|nr:ACT domain-containing protein [Sulfitobacter guttiformis]KIN73667.1 ACT 7 multi-domain protein [Sulfitobacter guttiformis KCTC 32187]RKE96310.1 hypothetical protein C8N30_0868 [Sulfitobacter guttiformis]